MPTPRKGESEKDFVKRCIPIVIEEGNADDGSQAAAICHSLWRRSKKGSAMRQWFTMKAGEDKSAEIIIYDEIGKSFWDDSGIGAKQFIDDLKELGDIKNITLRINSPGGDVFDGVAIHNALKNHGAKITAHVDGIAASIASYIAMAASRIVMPSNAFMLIHQAGGFVFGNSDDMRAVADDLDRIDKAITATYASRSKSSAAKIKAIMKEDRLMDASEAKELGLVDEVTADIKMAAHFSLRLLPKAAAERFRAETGTVQGDPPPAAPEPAKPEEQPPAPPVSPPDADPPPAPPQKPSDTPREPPKQPKQSADVHTLDAKKDIEEHRKYVEQVTDLCVLAGMPERIGAYVRANKPIDDVRKELLAVRSSGGELITQHPLAAPARPAVVASAWGKITDKLNARVKKES